jgi:hypothetical protein
MARKNILKEINVKKQKEKFLIKIFVLVICINIVFAIFPKQVSAQQNVVNFQEFYDQLSPYGQWIEDSNYGYIWIPTAGPDFSPYLSNGYWVMTDFGWMWESDYDWGWAPFHYGRWDYNGSYGWFWVPDSEWGPSWVTWRRSEGYYGWAPMRPGVSISVTFSNYNDVPNDRWIFVRDRDIDRHDIGRNHIDRRNNPDIMNHSNVIDKTYYDNKRHTTYVSGPGREDVQKITGNTIKPVSVHEKDKPGQSLSNGQLQIYRPQVQRNSSGHKPIPSELTKLQDVKHISQREAAKNPQNTQQPDNKIGTGERQPAVNLQNRNNNNNNSPQRPVTNSAGNNINKVQQPVVNPVKRIDNKNRADQLRNLNATKTEDKTAKPIQPQKPIVPRVDYYSQPPQTRTMNQPRNNNSSNQPQRTQTINSPKINRPEQAPGTRTMNPPRNNRPEQAPKTQTMNPPRNNRPEQAPKTQTMNPPKDNKIAQPQRPQTMNQPQNNKEDKPVKPNQNDDKKEK